MGKMTDEQVIRVLAEFMGWKRNPNQTHPGNGWFEPGKTHSECLFPPDYLNSYDAVVEVWRKFYIKHPYEADFAIAGVRWAATKRMGSVTAEAAWMHMKPREHANALAKAIADAKEAPNATSE